MENNCCIKLLDKARSECKCDHDASILDHDYLLGKQDERAKIKEKVAAEVEAKGDEPYCDRCQEKCYAIKNILTALED